MQIAHDLEKNSCLKKLGSSYGQSAPSHSIALTEAQAKKQARHRDEQNFQRQAIAGPQVSSHLTPSHLY